MSSHYTSSVVVVQSSRRPSAYSAPRSSTYSSSSYAQSTLSMDSSTASRSTFDAQYRNGSASSYYTDIKDVASSRGGATVTIVQHNGPNPDKNEPRSSDYQYYGGSYSKR